MTQLHTMIKASTEYFLHFSLTNWQILFHFIGIPGYAKNTETLYHSMKI